MEEELFKLKIIALLHDPFWKILNIENHEETMKEFLKKHGILEGDSMPKEVKIADILASSFDRFPLSFKGKDQKTLYKKYRSDNKLLYNIFSRTWTNIDEEKISQISTDTNIYKNNIYKNIIIEMKNTNKGIKDIYYALWTLLDIRIIEQGIYPLPQDTRMPLFDILDHVYSTASLVNLTYRGGFVVFVDIPSIQKFISKGRKLRDLFTGSWLISIIMYKFLEKIAEDLGPDTIITPTLRLNPFWINHFFEKYKYGWDEYEKLGLISRNWYRFAIIPGTALLILPKVGNLTGKDKVIEYIRNKFNETMNEFIESSEIAEKIRNIIETFKDKGIINIELEINEIKEIIRNIFDIKIYIVEKKRKDIKKYIKKYNKKYTKKFLDASRLWYDIEEELRKNKDEEIRDKVKYDSSEIAVAKILDKKIKEAYKNRKIEICSNCGKLPSVISFRRDKWDTIRNDPKNSGILNLFKPGERLCPVCLFKRISSDNKVYKNIIKKFLKINYSEEDEDSLVFLSTVDITIIPYAKWLIDLLKNENIDKDIRIIKEISSVIKEINEKAGNIINGLLNNIIMTLNLFGISMEESIKNIDIINLTILARIYKEPEILYSVLSEEDINKFIEKIEKESLEKLKNISNKKLKRIIEKMFYTKYYAIIYADGDNIGKLLLGNLEEALIREKKQEKEREQEPNHVDASGETKKTYYIEIFEEIIGKTIKDINKCDLDEVKKSMEEYLKNNNPLSLSYKIAISRSLMISTLLEVKEIFNLGGFVIYAGGDDLLVFTPKEALLDIINTSRKIFSGKENGWHKINDYYYFVQGLGYVGRSYSVVIAHYNDPLHGLLENLRNNEKRKEEIEYKIGNNKFEKNIVIVAYSRDIHNIIVIPFYFNSKDGFKVVFPAYEYIRKILSSQEGDLLYLHIDDLKEIITRGRIYSIIDEYRTELNLLSHKNKEYFKILLENVLKKSVKKELIKNIVDVDDIYVIKSMGKKDNKSYQQSNEKIDEEFREEHILFGLYDFIKILTRLK